MEDIVIIPETTDAVKIFTQSTYTDSTFDHRDINSLFIGKSTTRALPDRLDASRLEHNIIVCVVFYFERIYSSLFEMVFRAPRIVR